MLEDELFESSYISANYGISCNIFDLFVLNLFFS